MRRTSRFASCHMKFSSFTSGISKQMTRIRSRIRSYLWRMCNKTMCTTMTYAVSMAIGDCCRHLLEKDERFINSQPLIRCGLLVGMPSLVRMIRVLSLL